MENIIINNIKRDKLGRFVKGMKFSKDRNKVISESIKLQHKLKTRKCYCAGYWKGKNRDKKLFIKILEVRRKNGNMIEGKKHYNWKGGITPLNHSLRTSSKWKIWRELVFLRDNFTCQNLNCKFCNNKIGVMLHPHHIKCFAKFPELRFLVSNGITYCKEFHINSKLLHKNLGEIKNV